MLDPFAGSFSTGKAAVLEGFRFVGIEQAAEYVAIGRARLRHAVRQGKRTGQSRTPSRQAAKPQK